MTTNTPSKQVPSRQTVGPLTTEEGLRQVDWENFSETTTEQGPMQSIEPLCEQVSATCKDISATCQELAALYKDMVAKLDEIKAMMKAMLDALEAELYAIRLETIEDSGGRNHECQERLALWQKLQVESAQHDRQEAPRTLQ